MKFLDYAILAVFVIALVVCAFFWGCKLDPVITVVAALIALVSFVVTFIQFRKTKDLEEKE